MKNIARKNPFRVGDAVYHDGTKYRGIVKEVHADWVRMHVFGKTAPGGKPYLARFAYRKLSLIATREALMARALELKKQQDAANKPIERIARWIQNLWKKQPAPAGTE